MKKLTIGMATYDDYHGVFFTIQALRIYHPYTKTDEVEFLIIDNNPNSTHGQKTKELTNSVSNLKYIPYTEKRSATIKWKIPEYASGEYILIIDCHVLIQANGIQKLMEYYRQNPNTKDLIQAPLWYDDIKGFASSFKPEWRGNMYGTWSMENFDNNGEPFEIPMNGMGLFSFKKEHWPDINQDFKGFGSEEWYVNEKFRQNGGKTICLPYLKWVHRFAHPDGIKYMPILEDRIWNYYIGWMELYGIEHPMIDSITEHFKGKIPDYSLENIKKEAIEYTNKKDQS